MSRKSARIAAFQLIFSVNAQGGGCAELLEQYFEEQQLQAKDKEYIGDVVTGVFAHLQEIDAMIETNSRGWKIGRLSKVSLAVLRLAIYEMAKREDIPVSVSINEALELCREYDGEEARSFVNGLLGTVDKALKEGDLF